MPRSLNTRETRSGHCTPPCCSKRASTPVDYALSNSFGFGGTNCSAAVRSARRERVLSSRVVGIAAPGLAGWAAPRRRPARAPRHTSPPRRRRTRPRCCRRTSGAARRPRCARHSAPPKTPSTARGVDARELATVFASSDADMTVLHRICAALAQTTTRDFADRFPQLRAQRRERLLEHRRAEHGADDHLVRLRRELHGRTARGRGAGRATRARCAAGRLRRGRAAAVAREAAARGRRQRRHGPRRDRRSAASRDASRSTSARDAETNCANAALETLRLGNPALRALPLLELHRGAAARATPCLRGTGELRVRAVGTRHERVRHPRTLVPHAGDMCLLERIVSANESRDRRARRLRIARPTNPLRRDGRLAALHLAEYGAQAMAVHGGLQTRAKRRAAACWSRSAISFYTSSGSTTSRRAADRRR